MNAKQLAKIKARCEAATPGIWEARSGTTDAVDYPITTYYVWAYPYGKENSPQGVCSDIMRHGDCTFIANAKVDILALLGEIKRHQATVKKLKKERDVLLDCRRGCQRCHECPDIGCGDNLNPEAAKAAKGESDAG